MELPGTSGIENETGERGGDVRVGPGLLATDLWLRVVLVALIAWLVVSLAALAGWVSLGRIVMRGVRRPVARAHQPTDLTDQKRAGALASASVETALEALRDPYPFVRREAIRRLRDLGDLRAIPALDDVLQHDHSFEIREEAFEALARLRPRRVDEGRE